MKYVFQILFTTVATTVCFGQPKNEYFFSVGTGLSYSALRLDVISPYIFKDVSAPLQLGVRVKTPKNQYHMQWTSSNFDLLSESRSILMTEWKRSLQLSYHRLFTTSSPIQIFGGVVVEGKSFYWENKPITSSVRNASEHSALNISPSIYSEYTTRGCTATLQLWFPLVNYTSQLGYAMSFPRESHWAGPGSYRELNTRISLQRHLFSRFDLRVEYQLQVLGISVHETIRSMNNQFILALSFKIR